MGTRRQAIAALAALAVPCASRAQSKTYRVGVLGPERASDAHQKLRLELVRAGLRDLGYAEGRNLVIDARFAEGSYGRLPALADELVALKVDVIVALGSKAAEAAHRATKPADLPTEQPTRFDLVINVATAKALGLAIPQSLAVQARLI